MQLEYLLAFEIWNLVDFIGPKWFFKKIILWSLISLVEAKTTKLLKILFNIKIEFIIKDVGWSISGYKLIFYVPSQAKFQAWDIFTNHDNIAKEEFGRSNLRRFCFCCKL